MSDTSDKYPLIVANLQSILRKTALAALYIFLAALFFYLLSLPADASVGKTADRVLVIKSKRVLILLRDGEVLKTYRVALGKKPTGHKNRAGDQKTPEGLYVLDSRNPNSNYHLSLRISYPNDRDVENARMLNVSPGGDIMIHGLSKTMLKFGRFHKYRDWTNGCIAVTNEEIEEIWSLIPNGTAIEIRP